MRKITRHSIGFELLQKFRTIAKDLPVVQKKDKAGRPVFVRISAKGSNILKTYPNMIDKLGEKIVPERYYTMWAPKRVDHLKEITTLYQLQGENGVKQYCAPYMNSENLKSI